MVISIQNLVLAIWSFAKLLNFCTCQVSHSRSHAVISLDAYYMRLSQQTRDTDPWTQEQLILWWRHTQ